MREHADNLLCHPAPMDIAGLVLAAGFSRRMNPPPLACADIPACQANTVHTSGCAPTNVMHRTTCPSHAALTDHATCPALTGAAHRSACPVFSTSTSPHTLSVNKLLLPWQDAPLITHVVSAGHAAGLTPLCAVLRHDAEQALYAAVTRHKTLPVTCVHTFRSHEGQSASLADGIAALTSFERCEQAKRVAQDLPMPPTSQRLCGVIILLGDQPGVTPATIRLLMNTARAAPETPLALAFEGQRGHPVYIPRRLWTAVRGLRGDMGARDLLLGEGLQLVPCNDSFVCADVDNPDAYQQLLKRTLQH